MTETMVFVMEDEVVSRDRLIDKSELHMSISARTRLLSFHIQKMPIKQKMDRGWFFKMNDSRCILNFVGGDH